MKRLAVSFVLTILAFSACGKNPEISNNSINQNKPEEKIYDSNPYNLDAQTHSALMKSYPNELDEQAICNAFISKFGKVKPFTEILKAKEKNAEFLRPLFSKYLILYSANKYHRRAVKVPKTIGKACQMGVETERATVEMYEQFLSFVKEDDIRQIFIYLRDETRDKHLPAFERCNLN